MPEPIEPEKKKKGLKHWAMFSLRWGIAVAGVWYVVAHMSLRDQAWVILNHDTNRPERVSLDYTVKEDSPAFPVTNHGNIPREDVVNEPDQKTVLRVGHEKPSQLLGL